MGCYHPVYMIKKGLKDNGKQDLIFATQVSSNLGLSADELQKRYKDRIVPIPCGKCLGCKLSYSRDWAVRCVLESLDHSCNSFITLTYNEVSCPKRLVKKDFQDFMKRFRARHPGLEIRFFACGEYGSLNGRPHYHAVIFGYDFPDKMPLIKSDKNMLYTSDELSSLWTFGISSIGEVSLESCAYVARYSMKKASSSKGDEFLLMSRRPGLGASWFLDHKDIIYLSDHIYGRFGKSHVASVPRYFDKLAERENIDLSVVKDKRLTHAMYVGELSKKLHSLGHTEDINRLGEELLMVKTKYLRRYV